MKYIDRLRNVGLPNQHSEDYGTLAGALAKQMFAYCTSQKCCTYIVGSTSKKLKKAGNTVQTAVITKRREQISKSGVSGKDECPDCGQPLVWRKS